MGFYVPAVEFEGPSLDDHAMDFLLQDDSAGEEIARAVYDDPEHSWTVAMLHKEKLTSVSASTIMPKK